MKIKRRKELHDYKISEGKIMSKLISAITLLLFVSGLIFAQTDKYSKPTVWENYFIKDNNVIAQMPKLPVLIAGGNICRGENAYTLSAYSDGVVYVTTITSKTKVPEFCREKKNFDEQNFIERVENLKKEHKTAKFTENENEVKLIDEDKTFRIVNDFKNKRWFELQVYGASETKPEVKSFLNSLKIGEKLGAREIGSGSARNYGDENVSEMGDIEKSENTSIKDKIPTDKDDSVKLKIILKPRANYTDDARKNDIQGTVRLRVAFLSNGGIGSIDPVSTLPYGLTEQAMAAAAKIFFIPAGKSGKPVSVAKLVEYNFGIY